MIQAGVVTFLGSTFVVGLRWAEISLFMGPSVRLASLSGLVASLTLFIAGYVWAENPVLQAQVRTRVARLSPSKGFISNLIRE